MIRRLCEFGFGFCRAAALQDSKRPGFTNKLHDCCSTGAVQATCSAPRGQYKTPASERTLQVRILTWDCALRFQEAELHQQTLRLQSRQHWSCLALRAKKTLRFRILSRHCALRSQEAELHQQILQMLWDNKTQLQQKTLRVRILSRRCALRSQEAELHQQAFRGASRVVHSDDLLHDALGDTLPGIVLELLKNLLPVGTPRGPMRQPSGLLGTHNARVDTVGAEQPAAVSASIHH